MKRPERENYPIGVFGDIDYTDRLERYCSYLENKLTPQQNERQIKRMVSPLNRH